MRIMGFGTEERTKERQPQEKTVREEAPVRSLVLVQFEDRDQPLSYYNDRFALKEGDRVFVSGKLEGKVGVVTSAATSFRIRLSDYERVIALAQSPIAGTYMPVTDKMLSYDAEALSPEAFRRWILPPAPEEPADELITVGDGWSVPLGNPPAAEGVDRAVFERALIYCKDGRVAYISVRGGIGKAFVEGTDWYAVDFRLKNDVLTEGFCSCPYYGLCKHLLAVGVTLATLRRRGEIDLERDFVLIQSDRFFDMIRRSGQAIRM